MSASLASTQEEHQEALRLLISDYAIHRTYGSNPSQSIPCAPQSISTSEHVKYAAESRQDLHVWGDGYDPTLNPHPRVPGVVNPTTWPSDRYRRVPDYAPVNYRLNFQSRPIGDNPIASAFLTVTFIGCSLISVWSLPLYFHSHGIFPINTKLLSIRQRLMAKHSPPKDIRVVVAKYVRQNI